MSDRPVTATPPADACAVLTITTDRGTIEAWVTFDDLHVATARFIEAPAWPWATHYIVQIDGITSAVAARGLRWYFVHSKETTQLPGNDGQIVLDRLPPADQSYAVDLRRAAEAALVMNGSHSKGRR